MFAPPPDIQTEIFTRMPDQFRRPGTRTEWADVMAHGAHLDCFLEGPSFDGAGNLYVTDIPYGRVFKIDPGGTWTLVAEYDGEPNGLKFHKDGRALITDHKQGIMSLDPATGMVTPFVDRPILERFKGTNDLFFADDGTIYFTDQGQTGLQDLSGRVYRISPDGALSCILENVPSPNGLVMNEPQTILYLAVTRDNAVWRVPLVGAAKMPSKVGVFIQLSGGLAGPDGMALDTAGNVVVAHAGLGTVWLFSRLGEPLARIRSCAGLMTTNVAFGGQDRRTLYITESETGSILTAPMPEPGMPMWGPSA